MEDFATNRIIPHDSRVKIAAGRQSRMRSRDAPSRLASSAPRHPDFFNLYPARLFPPLFPRCFRPLSNSPCLGTVTSTAISPLLSPCPGDRSVAERWNFTTRTLTGSRLPQSPRGSNEIASGKTALQDTRGGRTEEYHRSFFCFSLQVRRSVSHSARTARSWSGDREESSTEASFIASRKCSLSI